MTKVGGCQYNVARQVACDCLRSETKVDYRRTDAIRVMKQWHLLPTTTVTKKKAKERAQKATTPHKMAALMRNLIAK
jgi:hypothetical protein